VLEAWRNAVAERDRAIVELSAAVRSRDEELAQLRAGATEAAQAPPVEPDPAAQAELEQRLAAAQAEREQLRTELGERDRQLAAAVERAKSLSAEYEALQARLASAGSSAEDRGREVGEARAQVAAFSAELQSLRPRLAAAEAEVTALRAHVAEADGRVRAERDARAADIEASARKVANAEAAVARVRTQLETRDTELGQLKSEAAEQTRELDFLRSRLATPTQAEPETEPVDDGPHIVFVPRNGGYELVERDGRPPARGETVVLDAAYVVAKVGPSPRPGERRTCVYLVRA
jgi:regulator of replication initiation timing